MNVLGSKEKNKIKGQTSSWLNVTKFEKVIGTSSRTRPENNGNYWRVWNITDSEMLGVSKWGIAGLYWDPNVFGQ